MVATSVLVVTFAVSFILSHSTAFGISSRAKINDLSVTRKSPTNSISMLARGKKDDAKVSVSTTPLKSTASATPAVKSDEKTLAEKLKVGFLFALWYAFNIGYNIENKKLCNNLPTLTWTIALLQLLLGLIYVIPVWGLGIRKAPVLNSQEIKNLLPVAVLHTLTHIGAVISLSAGSVSFTHIVKAAEPAVSAFLSAVFTKSFLPLPVYLSLVPVMGGVAIASLTELSFSWLSFSTAMLSNFASASRAIVGKISMGKPQGKNMSATNLYAVMTILASLILAPFALAKEGQLIGPIVQSLKASGKFKLVALQALGSALYYYLYNEVAFMALDNVAPVTHALANTIKRVVIIITSVVVLGSKMSAQGAVGSAIAILGVLLYSLAKNYFK